MRKRFVVQIIISYFLVAISVFLIALGLLIHILPDKQPTHYVTDLVYVTNSILDSLDPNQILGNDNPVFTVVDQEPNEFAINWKKAEIYQSKTVRLDTIDLNIPGVMGTCWNGKGSLRREYPVLIDTGNAGNVLVTDSIVKDSQLGFYPRQVGDGRAGFCHLCQLKIGDITFVHPVCSIRSGHYEKKVGEDVQIEHEILLGLGMLKSFKYVLIDTPASQIEFFLHDPFDPNEPELWQNFPMTIETPKRNNDILFVTIPINGKSNKVPFDTGAAIGLLIPPSYWEEFSKSLDYEGPKKVNIKKFDGFKKTEYYTVKELEFAGYVVSNANIMMGLPKDSNLGNGKILLGMEFFEGRALVLDFENELLWVKKKR